MISNIISTLAALLIIVPLYIKFKDKELGYSSFITVIVYHFIYGELIFMPFEYSQLWIDGTNFNWIGKSMSLTFSIIFLLIQNRHLGKNPFFTRYPERQSFRRVFIVGGVAVIIMCLLSFVFSGGKQFDVERLFYQLTMPGLDEEVWRGIVIGSFVSLLKTGKYKFGHPAIWISAILFSLGHAVYFNENGVGFTIDAFIISGVLGYLLGWVILYSKSIIPAIILHNAINFLSNLVEMIK